MTEEQAHYVIDVPAHDVVAETLHHFKCHACQNWWSIGDWKPVKYIYCPHCGIRAIVEDITQKS